MKLIFCPHCQDLIKMRIRKRFCACRKAWGQYEKDGLYAKIGGEAIAIGIYNGAFTNAVATRPPFGIGPEFHGFVFPEKSERVQRVGSK